MTARSVKPGFAARPGDADAWVGASATQDAPAGPKADLYTARLTVDVTPALRGRIKVAAFQQGLTVADMLRTLLDERFPGAAP